MHDCIARTWFKEHIWVAVGPFASEADERTVIMTVEIREGRGHEKERTQALFDRAGDVFARIVGTKPEEFILLVRQFGQDDCISGGGRFRRFTKRHPTLMSYGRGDKLPEVPPAG